MISQSEWRAAPVFWFNDAINSGWPEVGKGFSLTSALPVLGRSPEKHGWSVANKFIPTCGPLYVHLTHQPDTREQLPKVASK